LHDKDRLEKHERYHKIMQAQNELQYQELEAEKNKIKNQAKIS
jgi:hypothetical protein